MDFKESKLEIVIVTAAVLLLFSMMSLFKSISPSSQIETKKIVYEMPRPMSPELESDFDLANREITREYLNGEFKGVADKNKPVAGIPAKTPDKKDKTKDNKKSSKNVAKKSQLKVDIIPGTESYNRFSEENFANTKVNNSKNVNKQAVKENQNSPENKEEDKKKAMSIEEWRQLLMAEPTLANMNKFLMAFRKKEILSDEYYGLSQELVVSAKKEHQAAGLYALQSSPSVTSFSMIVKNLPLLSEEARITGQQILLSYSQPQNLGYLSQALQSSDPEVVKHAAEAITYGLAKVKKVPKDPKAPPGEVAASSVVQSYGRFLQVFETWQQSGDQMLMGLAQNFLSAWNS